MSEFVYIPPNYPGPIALDAKLSEEAKEYFSKSVLQFNIGDKVILKRVKEKTGQDLNQ